MTNQNQGQKSNQSNQGNQGFDKNQSQSQNPAKNPNYNMGQGQVKNPQQNPQAQGGKFQQSFEKNDAVRTNKGFSSEDDNLDENETSSPSSRNVNKADQDIHP